MQPILKRVESLTNLTSNLTQPTSAISEMLRAEKHDEKILAFFNFPKSISVNDFKSLDDQGVPRNYFLLLSVQTVSGAPTPPLRWESGLF
jgi:hypothetical protein